MGRLVPTNQIILGYGKGGMLVYDASREPTRKIPGLSAEYVPPTPAAPETPSVSSPANQSGYMLSLSKTSGRGSGYMGYGLKAETAPAQTDGNWRGLSHYALSGVASLSNLAADIGSAIRDSQTGRDYNALLHAGEIRQTVPAPGTYGTANLTPVTVRYSEKQAGAEARANFPYLSEAERETARTKSGAELGAYINGLNLSERRREAETRARRNVAAGIEANAGAAEKREGVAGRPPDCRRSHGERFLRRRESPKRQRPEQARGVGAFRRTESRVWLFERPPAGDRLQTRRGRGFSSRRGVLGNDSPRT